MEENLTSTQKEVTELRSCLREVERSRLEARRELQELRRQVRHRTHQAQEVLVPSSLPLQPCPLLAAAQGPGRGEGAEGAGGGRAADPPGAGGAAGGGEGEGGLRPQAEAGRGRSLPGLAQERGTVQPRPVTPHVTEGVATSHKLLFYDSRFQNKSDNATFQSKLQFTGVSIEECEAYKVSFL